VNTLLAAQCLLTFLFCTACVNGLSDQTLSTCDATGGNDTVSDPNYTCSAGFYKVAAPEYCKGDVNSPGDAMQLMPCCR
jgi:hypothetical protein